MQNIELFYSYAGVISIIMMSVAGLVFAMHLFYQGIRRNQFNDVRRIMAKVMGDLDRYFEENDKLHVADVIAVMGEVSRMASPEIALLALDTVRKRNATRHMERLEARGETEHEIAPRQDSHDTPFFTRRDERPRSQSSGLRIATR